MKKKLLIAYSPFENESNHYTDNFKKILSHFGEVSNTPTLKKIMISFSFRRYDVMILNWSDNSFVNRHTGSISVFGVLKEFFRIANYRLLSRKTIFVRHNVYPHDAKGESRATAVRIIGWYEKCFDLCWVHSGHFAKDNRFYVPHPLYAVEKDAAVRPVHIALPEKYFVVFGRIQSYKKIDRLIELLPSDLHIVVCGTCPEPEYKTRLQAFNNPNVTLLAEFISDELARDLIVHSAGMLICHADDDMIVSGSIVFAISLGVPVFAIHTPFVNWFRDAVNDKMIVAATDFPDLIDKMKNVQSQINAEDIAASQAHFSDHAVISHVASTFKRLELI